MLSRSRRLTLALLAAAALGLPAASLDTGQDPDAPATFPVSWHGTWRGTCSNVAPGRGVLQTFPMELRVEPTRDDGRTRWVVVYGQGERKQVRDYRLITVDAARGHYRIDERNSIVLDAHWIPDSLHQMFRVGKTLLHVRFTRQDERMTVAMASFFADRTRKSGGEKAVPAVTAYPLKVVQQGELTRVK